MGKPLLVGFDRTRMQVDQVRLSVGAVLSSAFSFGKPPVDPWTVARYVAARPRGCVLVPLPGKS